MDQLERRWPALAKDDAGLLDELLALLTTRAPGSPYGSDSTFSANIAHLPHGLRAMAATHWLDLSLTLDSLTWHFGNFGEAELVAQTEAGLRELGMHELAGCFSDAKQIMLPLLACYGGDPYSVLHKTGLEKLGAEINKRARALSVDEHDLNRSLIYEAWVRYARQCPERVFD